MYYDEFHMAKNRAINKAINFNTAKINSIEFNMIKFKCIENYQQEVELDNRLAKRCERSES